MIYTIGYQGLTPEFLRRLVEELDATLIDCRSSTRSRIPGFGGRQLAALLPGRYEDRGKDLGGRGPINPQAIEELRERFYAQDKPDCVLMCMEANVADCHRHHAIAAPHFPEALHIDRQLRLFTAAQVQQSMEEDITVFAVGELSLE